MTSTEDLVRNALADLAPVAPADSSAYAGVGRRITRRRRQRAATRLAAVAAVALVAVAGASLVGDRDDEPSGFQTGEGNTITTGPDAGQPDDGAPRDRAPGRTASTPRMTACRPARRGGSAPRRSRSRRAGRSSNRTRSGSTPPSLAAPRRSRTRTRRCASAGRRIPARWTAPWRCSTARSPATRASRRTTPTATGAGTGRRTPWPAPTAPTREARPSTPCSRPTAAWRRPSRTSRGRHPDRCLHPLVGGLRDVWLPVQPRGLVPARIGAADHRRRRPARDRGHPAILRVRRRGRLTGSEATGGTDLAPVRGWSRPTTPRRSPAGSG